MLQEEYDILTRELEPFREDWTDPETGQAKRIITAKTQFKWLESKKIIRFGTGAYSNSPAIIYPTKLTDAEVAQRYSKYEDMLSNYMSGKILQNVGKMGVKTPSSLVKDGEINPDDIPF